MSGRLVGARVKHSTTQSRATNTALIFDQEDYDDAAFHDTVTNNSRLTVPSGLAGRYIVGAFAKSAAGASQVYGVYLQKNGADAPGAMFVYSNGTEDKQITVVTVIDAVATDYFEVKVNYAAGPITWGTACRFWCQRVG